MPFLVAFEIALAGNPAYADAFPICHAPGSQNAAPANNQANDRSNPDGCPICAAMAVGQAFTTPAPVAAPLPRIFRYVEFGIALPVQRSALACTPYQSRAPPALI